MKLFLSILSAAILATLIGQLAFAIDGTISAKATVPPKWKTTFNSYYYDFEGTQAQKNDAYEFGDTTLKMQMMGLQYQTDNGWTLMMLAQYYENFVVTRIAGTDYKDSSRGIADTYFAASKAVVLSPTYMILTDVGFTAPTGSIDEENPRVKGLRYPYNMQMGSGTYDAVLGVMPLWFTPSFQYGSRLSATLRTGDKTDNGYRLGNLYRLDAWVDMPTSVGLTPRVVGYYKHKDAIQGMDTSFGRNALVEFYHHDQINWDVSAALKYQRAFGSVSLNAEAGIPLAQDSLNYDKVVVSTQYYLNLGVTGQF